VAITLGANASQVNIAGKMRKLADEVQVAFQANRKVYGSPRLHAELQAQGRRCGRKRIARLMRELHLSAQLPRHRRITTKSEKGARVAENLLLWNFHADEPNRKWVTDTTYIWTAEGWLSLAVVLDLFSRMVGGWAMAPIQDAALVGHALHMALARRRPQAGLLHHSDRGSPYTSQSDQAILLQEGIQVSMSRTGNCYDHAAMESFFHSLKAQCIDRECFQTRAQARRATFEYIGCFYNRTRRHSTLNYVSPVIDEQLMC
jgi:putative transposase